MKISFVSNPKNSPIEPSSNPMTITPPPTQNSEGFFFPMPTGERRGDIAYWDPSAGAGATGAWIKLNSPQATSSDDPIILNHDGNDLSWSSIGLQEILNRLTLVEGSVDVLEGTVNSLESTVNSLEGAVNSLEGAVNSLESAVNSLESAVNSLEAEVLSITSRLNNATIDAECQDGTVLVTLNL